MRFHLVVLALIAVHPISAAAADPCDKMPLPATVRHLLRDKYPEWRPKQMSDLDQDDKEIWSGENLGSCPGIAVGHFEDPAQLAYAVLMVPTSDRARGYKVVMVAETKGSDGYELKLLDHADAPACSCLVISKANPGKYSGFDDPKSVRLKLDGINVEWLEKSSVLYFYSNGKYQQLETSD